MGKAQDERDMVNGSSSRASIFGLERNVFYIGLVSFFNDLSSEMVYPLLPFFLVRVLGAGAFFLGLVEGMADSVASMLQLVSGWFSDRLGKRKGIAAAGYSLSGVSRGMLALVVAPWQALLAWFFNRVGKGIRTAPRDALIADSCSPLDRGRSFGYHRAMDHLGALSGAALASILLATVTSDYRAIFGIAFIPVAVSLVIIALGVRERGDLTSRCESDSPSIQKIKLSLKPFDRRFKIFILAVFCFTLGNSSDAFLLLKAGEVAKIPLALIPSLWGVLHVVKAIANIQGGSLSDRIGRKRVLLLGWFIYFLAYLGFAITRSAGWFWFLLVLYGLYYMTEAAGKALVADLVPVYLRGTAFGIYNFVVSISLLPASLLMGLLWQTIGARYAFLLGSSLAALACLILLWVREPEQPADSS